MLDTLDTTATVAGYYGTVEIGRLTGWRNDLVACKRTLNNPVEAVKRPVFPVLPVDG